MKHDDYTTAASTATTDFNLEDMVAAMEKFRAVQSPLVPPGSMFVMNPVEFRTIQTMPVITQTDEERRGDFIRMKYEFGCTPQPQGFCGLVDLHDEPAPKSEPIPETRHNGVLFVLLAVLLVTLIGVCAL